MGQRFKPVLWRSIRFKEKKGGGFFSGPGGFLFRFLCGRDFKEPGKIVSWILQLLFQGILLSLSGIGLLSLLYAPLRKSLGKIFFWFFQELIGLLQ